MTGVFSRLMVHFGLPAEFLIIAAVSVMFWLPLAAFLPATSKVMRLALYEVTFTASFSGDPIAGAGPTAGIPM